MYTFFLNFTSGISDEKRNISIHIVAKSANFVQQKPVLEKNAVRLFLFVPLYNKYFSLHPEFTTFFWLELSNFTPK